MTKKEQMDMNRRQFLKRLGLGAGSAMAMTGRGKPLG
ncbi:twin-arginine translocation signal domain-containing protein [uncultured Prevotella sp.]|nr:twin-arginine translocation signal domain-containing protein [uncultured Prevotella sp.]